MQLLFYSLYLNISALSLLFVLLIIGYYKYTFAYWKKKNIPSLTPTIPFGNIKELVMKEKSFAETFTDMYFKAREMSAKYLGFYFLIKPHILIVDTSIIKTIITTKFHSFNGRGIFNNGDVDPLNDNIAFLSGEKWKFARGKLTNLFTPAKLKAVFPLLIANCRDIDAVLKEHSTTEISIDIKELMEQISLNNIASCVYGLESNSYRGDSDIRRFGNMYLKHTLSNASKIGLSLIFPKLFKYFRIHTVQPEISDFYTNLFNDTVEARRSSGKIRKDFLDEVIALENEENEENYKTNKQHSVTKKQKDFRRLMTANAFALLTAGWETSSGTVSFCMAELAANADIQEKVRLEINDVLRRFNGEMTYEALTEMAYLDQVISETLRKYPVIPVLMRLCNETCQLPNTNLTIEAGTLAWIPVMGIHRDPEYYPNPDRFDPDRFKEDHHPPTYMPFGDGPKFCIGIRFGLLQVKCGLVALLRNYKFSFCKGNAAIPKLAKAGMILRFEDSLYLQAEEI